MKVIKDLQGYLGEIEKMADELPKKQTRQLETILTSIMTLLVCLRKASNLGEITIDRRLL